MSVSRTQTRTAAAIGGALMVLLLPSPASAGTRASEATGSSVHFTTPSGNIDCFMSNTADSRFANCLVQDYRWARTPTRTADCHLDHYPGEVLLPAEGRAKAGACRGDVGPLCGPSGLDGCVVLGYGNSKKLGSITCKSARTGVTCRQDGADGHGFRISRSGYSLY